MLQARFAIVGGPACFWARETLKYIMKACILMHNMIVEDEHGEELDLNYDTIEGSPIIEPSHEHTLEFLQFT